MSEQLYTASKSRSNRPGWSVTFRHPLRNDARGKPGLKMRRGLGTTDEAEADRLVTEMNILLSDSSWWNAAKRAEAERKFSVVVVGAFYDEIQAGRDDPEALREALVPLPGMSDGYSRVMFVGTTGAGKTSLLRHLIGSDPDRDRFPSTAPAKTTIADIEIVQADGDYEAVVTFFSEFQTQASIEECIVDACLAAYEDAPIEKVADRFLNHRDQKFRLSYVLGGWRKEVDSAEADDSEDDFSFDGEGPVNVAQEEAELPDTERAKNHEVLRGFIDRVVRLKEKVAGRLSADLGIDARKPEGPDREAAEQLIEENLEAYVIADEGFHELVQDVLDAVRSRFDLIDSGEIDRHRSGWPRLWTLRTGDRDEFVRQIRWFSSNFWPQFGRLLTPLVCGIRVKGPLFPTFTDKVPRLVLVDGEGLGHTPDTASSVTTRVTKRFEQVDVILLVDNAKQPMQPAPLSVLKAVAASGHNAKLAVAFTHFDHIKGNNLRTSGDKRAHVMASVLNALSSLQDVLGAPVVRSVEHGIDDRCFMLGGIDQTLARLPARAADYMRGELARLVDFCERAILPPPPPKAGPVYDPTGVSFSVREAVTKFQGPWGARLGQGRPYEGIGKEHWTRVKALNRRIAGELSDEYDRLRPVADLVARLTESVSRFLDEPIEWEGDADDEEERQAAIARIRRAVSAAVHELAKRRLVEEHLGEWRTAYDYRGTGSTFDRARAIHRICNEAAPMPDAVMPPPSKQFLIEVRRIVIGAIEANGGHVRLSDVA